MSDPEEPFVHRDPLKRLMETIQVQFGSARLLLEALTHRSYVNESTWPEDKDNERLEFLGDAVLDLVVSEALMARLPEADEGTLSRARAAMVHEGALAALAKRIDLGAALRLGRGEEKSGGRDRASILSDAFEALVAAVFVEQGLDGARALLMRLLEFPDARPRGDPKTELQERLQATRHTTPSYRVISEDGPDHSKTFVVLVESEGVVLGEGRGTTKKQAEQDAAAAVLRTLDADR